MPARGLFGVLLFVSSAGTIQKYAGTAAAVVSLPVLVLVAVTVLPRLEERAGRSSDRWGLYAGIAVLVLLAVALVLVYPHANSHAPGAGSDRDDAANIGARRILDGHYPYGRPTYLGNPISQLPGALVFAAPFVAVLHSSAYANILWLAVLAALVAAAGRRLPAAVAVVAATLALSPGLLREYATGGDLIANTVYVAAASVAVLRLAGRRAGGPLAALVLGVALASRANLALVLIPLAAALFRRHGLRRTGGLLAVSLVAAGSLVAIAAARPAGRASIRVADHLNVLGRAGSAAVVLVAVGVAILLAARTRNWTPGTMLGQAALVQAVFPIALVAHASVVSAGADFSPLVSGYGVPALLLAVPCAWLVAARAAGATDDVVVLEPVPVSEARGG